jgi:sulfatase maturation enzyme AslB (radical SAM superfamily)
MQRVKEIRIQDVEECKGCELRSWCATGCRANAYFLNGDFENGRDDYACMAVRFFVDQVMPFLRREGVLS